jgi:hypothetical protein
MNIHSVTPLLALLCAFGCTTVRTTEPPRSATEQLLISTAADRVMTSCDLAPLAGKRVFLDTASFDGLDKAYAIGTVADRLSTQGALLVADRKDADVVATIRSGALSIDRTTFLIGIPPIPLPVPLVGILQTPELALFKRDAQTGLAKVGLTACETPSGKHALSVGPVSSTSYYNVWTMLFVISFRTTNIPEKQRRHWWNPWS